MHWEIYHPEYIKRPLLFNWQILRFRRINIDDKVFQEEAAELCFCLYMRGYLKRVIMDALNESKMIFL